MRVTSYVRWTNEVSLHYLREASQPDLHFAGQTRGWPVRGGSTCIVIPNCWVIT